MLSPPALPSVRAFHHPRHPLLCSASRSPLPSSSSSSLHPSACPPPTPSSPLSPLRSASHSFTAAQFNTYRLFALIGASAASNSLAFLSHLAAFIPLGYEAEAAEAVLPIQVYAGIPKTIEAMQLVRAELDRRETAMREGGEESRRAGLRQRRQRGEQELRETLREAGEELAPLWASYDDPRRPPPDPALSLSAEYPSLPADHAAAAAASSSAADINPTALRISRGLTALTAVYSTSAPKLLSSLRQLHPSLHHSVLQHIYGAVLCSPVLPLPCLELISVACLLWERNPRQLFSHIRGALMNGCTRAMCDTVMQDAALLYAAAMRREQEAGLQFVDDALLMLRKIDRKVNPAQPAPLSEAASPGVLERQQEAGDSSSSGSSGALLAPPSRKLQPSHSLPSNAKL